MVDVNPRSVGIQFMLRLGPWCDRECMRQDPPSSEIKVALQGCVMGPGVAKLSITNLNKWMERAIKLSISASASGHSWE